MVVTSMRTKSTDRSRVLRAVVPARRQQLLRATSSSSGGDKSSAEDDAEEARLAALEASIKGRAAPKQATRPLQQQVPRVSTTT